MKHKEYIQKEISNKGFNIGCFDEQLESISKYTLKKILNEYYHESTDIDITINRKKYVLEISVVDNEVDFSVISKEEYINVYGDERWNI